ncbi:hypothetical protein HPB50_023174 [Hyalomma asiaticum]|uniref:Uncharacterized protein n=1 Tax=Hyalomma asiaticum TaxID=266040 RepID=A0ACB7TMD8_HYAAI|nr:hypothetical protein HPB50_023174 [Hyalomma asiaticum]
MGKRDNAHLEQKTKHASPASARQRLTLWDLSCIVTIRVEFSPSCSMSPTATPGMLFVADGTDIPSASAALVPDPNAALCCYEHAQQHYIRVGHEPTTSSFNLTSWRVCWHNAGIGHLFQFCL